MERLVAAVGPDHETGEDAELPRYESGCGPGSTAEVDFETRREPYPVVKSHVNAVVPDTARWEQSAACRLDAHERVHSFVKNADLGFAIPYLHNGRHHEYLPDFIVRLAGGEARFLILETKGYDPLTEVKSQAAERWVRAVNADGRFGVWIWFGVWFGVWIYALVSDIVNIREVIERSAADPLIRHDRNQGPVVNLGSACLGGREPKTRHMSKANGTSVLPRVWRHGIKAGRRTIFHHLVEDFMGKELSTTEPEFGASSMKYLNFRIKNFKGIKDQEIRLDKSPTGRVFTLVGLNESGKTTILEAISLLESREKHLESLYQEEFRHGDVHDRIPIKNKANFNESIKISSEISMSASDIDKIIHYIYNNFSFRIDRNKFPNTLTITKEMKFKDSIYIGTTNWWGLSLIGKPDKQRKNVNLSTFDKKIWDTVITEINQMIPSILYFPTFLFEFPEYIYVSEETDESEKNAYYRSVIKDILDSLSDENNKYNIDQHIVNRARSDSRPAIRALNALLNKMGRVVSQTVFKMWNDIFERDIPRKDLVINYGTEDVGNGGAVKVYLEFSIKDGDEIYLITERSLGFRWFFCFILFTHFRQYRKEQKEILFLFDEPASNLHLRAQMQLLCSFTKMIDEGHGKIIYSTHSHYMINPKWLENTYIVSNGGIYDTDRSIYEYSSRDTDIHIMRYREFASIYPDKENYFQPILNALEYAPSRLEFVPDSIFVEGKNDFYMIKYFEDVFLEIEEPLSIIPGTGSGGFETLIRLYMGWGKKFVILLDDDREGRKCRERYIQEWHLSKCQVFTLGDIHAEWENFEIENLFSAISIDNLRNKIHPYNKNNKLSKKEIARFLQEKMINRDRNDISDETISMFSKLIVALKDKLR